MFVLCCRIQKCRITFEEAAKPTKTTTKKLYGTLAEAAEHTLM